MKARIKTRAKQLTFHTYRYQILPTSQEIQLDLDKDIRSIDDLRAKKNFYFEHVVSEIKRYTYSRAPLIDKKISMDDDVFIMRIAVERDLTRLTKDFEEETIEHWPDTLVAMNNDPAIQTCIIQTGSGFRDTGTVAKILETNLNEQLRHYQLSVAFEPIYEKKVFWDIIQRYEGLITQVEFELVSPNMSNISGALSIDLGLLNRNTNTQRTNIKLNSDSSSSLSIKKDDPIVSGLVDYASQGGGDITMRAKGMHKKIHTARGVNEIHIDELEIHTANTEQLKGIFKDLLK